MSIETRARILNVNDDRAIRRSLSLMLERTGFEVMEAENGEQALDLVKQGPDLVLLDVHLPDIDGFEVCRRIKTDPMTASIPVLNLSATYRDNRSRALSLESGADAYLTFPVETPVLVSSVNTLLRIRDGEQRELLAGRQWQTTFDAIRDGICLLDAQGRVVRCNRAIQGLLSKSAGEIVGQTCETLMASWADDLGECPFRRVTASRKRETMLLEAGGCWFELTIDPILDETGELTGAVQITSDVTSYKQTDNRIKHLNRVLQAVRNISQLIIRERNPASLLQLSCDELAVSRGYKSVWIAFHDERGKLSLVAAEDTQEPLAELRLCFQQGGEVPACGRAALAQSEVVVSRGFARECENCPLAEHYPDCDAMAARLESNGTVYGLISVAAPPGVVLDGEEVALFREIVGDIGFALHTISQERERRELAAALERSEAHLRTITTASQDAIVMIDDEGLIRFWNPAAAEIFGYDESEAMGQPVHELIAAEQHLPAFRAAWAKFKQTGEWHAVGQTWELAGRRKGGTTFPVELSLSAIQVEGRWWAVGVMRDISKRKQNDLRIARLASVIEQVSESVVITDLVGNIIYVNPFFEMLTGYTRREALGQNPRMLQSGQHDASFYRELWDTLTAGGTWRGMFVDKRSDGSLYNEDAVIFPVKDTAGRTINYAAVKSDVTERKRADDERERLVHELQQVLAEVKTLKGFLPICASCKKIRDDGGYWHRVEEYIHDHAEVEFTHGLCPDCARTLYAEYLNDEDDPEAPFALKQRDNMSDS